MRIVRTIAALRAAIAEERGERGSAAPAVEPANQATPSTTLAPPTVALVPTMGALHEGHLTLIRAARAAHEIVVVSVFVNPTQFNEAADLETYPRNEQRDAELAEPAGASILFAPAVDEMYPSGFATTVRVTGPITETLEGASRGSAHFDGVATIVAKLLLASAPDAAYFGAKDAQQVVVVRRMVADLGLPVRIAVCPTSRDADGLARSSRNARLTSAERAAALAIPRALAAAEAAVAAGERSAEAVRSTVVKSLETAGLVVEYVALVDPTSFAPLADLTAPALLVLAARSGAVRLIDNALLEPAVAR